MVTMFDAIREARKSGNPDALVRVIPYARAMGFSMSMDSGELIGKMAFAPHLVGNATLPALHGGTLGALLEVTAVFKLMMEGETAKLPKTINITVEYLRSAKAVDTYARAQFTRHGRRVANVRAFAYQDDPDRPVAAANAHFLLVPESESE